MAKASTAAFAVLMTMSACSGGGSGATPTSAESTSSSAAPTTVAPMITEEPTTTTEAATTTTLSELEQAQVAYFYASAEINGTIDKEWDKACGSAGPGCKTIGWSAWKGYCIALASAQERFAAAVASYDWPERAQDEADALVKRDAEEAQIRYECKNANSNAELRAIDKKLTDLGPYGEAAALRLALGLPINQG